MENFSEYIPTFMQVFLDNFVVYNRKNDHLEHLQICLEKCQQGQLSLNPMKCVFGITNGTLLGNIASQDGIVVDPDKVKAIMDAPVPTNARH